MIQLSCPCQRRRRTRLRSERPPPTVLPASHTLGSLGGNLKRETRAAPAAAPTAGNQRTRRWAFWTFCVPGCFKCISMLMLTARAGGWVQLQLVASVCTAPGVELLHGECCLESLHCTCKARNEQVSIVAACASMSAAGSNWEGVSSTLAQGGARGARAQAKATRRRTGPTHCHPPVGGSENHAFSLGARG